MTHDNGALVEDLCFDSALTIAWFVTASSRSAASAEAAAKKAAGLFTRGAHRGFYR
jgi:hypothetical protein